MKQTMTKKSSDGIRKILVQRFGSGTFNVTTTNRRSGVGSINIKFSTQKANLENVLDCLRDNGYDHIVVTSCIKDIVILSGYVSEHNYSIAAFA